MAGEMASTPAIERIARVLAARAASANADGDEISAAAIVDQVWPSHRDDAVSILKALREPDAAIASAGDAGLWTRMVEAALGDGFESTAIPTTVDPQESPTVGSNPLIEGP